MMKSRVGSKGLTEDIFSLLSPFLIVTAIIALLLGAIIALIDPVIGTGVIGILVMAIIIMLRQDELAAALVVAIHLYVDWYLGARVAALVIVLLLLGVFFLARSPQRPWTGLRFSWLWVLFLAFAFFPATNGLTIPDGFTYYLDIMVGAMLTFWLGTVIVQNVMCLRRFLKILSGLGALLAVHTLIQASTGVLVLGTSRFDAFLAKASNLELAGSAASRVGSFFVDPNWNGTFFAMMALLPLGVYFESKSLIEKLFCLAATFLMLTALLFTYSNGAWIAISAGLLTFVVLVGHFRHSVQILSFIFVLAVVIATLFPTQIHLQFQHASGTQELSSRVAAWKTAIQVIHAFPLTGIGLGIFAYLARADPYRDPQQYMPLAHPHNAYLELGAMAGLPVLAIFMTLLVLGLCRALHNWASADRQTRSLFAGSIAAVIALSINSISINGWTLAPLAAAGWLILGAIPSNVVKKPTMMQEKNSEYVKLCK